MGHEIRQHFKHFLGLVNESYDQMERILLSDRDKESKLLLLEKMMSDAIRLHFTNLLNKQDACRTEAQTRG